MPSEIEFMTFNIEGMHNVLVSQSVKGKYVPFVNDRRNRSNYTLSDSFHLLALVVPLLVLLVLDSIVRLPSSCDSTYLCRFRTKLWNSYPEPEKLSDLVWI